MADSIKKRVITAAVLIAVLLVVVLWLPPEATVIALTVVVLAGAWEWSAFLRASRLWQRLLYVAVVAVLLPLVWNYTKGVDGLKLVLQIAVAWWVVALGWVMFAPRLVSSSAAAMRDCSRTDRLRRSPMNFTRTLFWCRSAISRSSASMKSDMRLATSSVGRFQFSLEKANTVSASTLCFAHSSIAMRTEAMPCLWPDARAMPRAAAQRPLPSMMIAMCRGTPTLIKPA